MRMLDLFCGRGGWTNAFLERGWEVVGVDLVRSADYRGEFIEANVLSITSILDFDFVCASSVCDGFASFGMKHFRPNPPFPKSEIDLFVHTQSICAESGLPYVMENVRTAQQFVGLAVSHCGPFYLWGNAVPPIMPQGISKAKWRSNVLHGRNAPGNFAPELNLPKKQRKALLATIPPELANCVADYAERICEKSNSRESRIAEEEKRAMSDDPINGMTLEQLARFDEASNHPYECQCEICKEWWAQVPEEE